MTDTNAQYPTGTYTKGDRVRVARTAGEAVAAVFEGFKLSEAPKAEAQPTENASEATPLVEEKASGTEPERAPRPRAPKQTQTDN